MFYGGNVFGNTDNQQIMMGQLKGMLSVKNSLNQKVSEMENKEQHMIKDIYDRLSAKIRKMTDELINMGVFKESQEFKLHTSMNVSLPEAEKLIEELDISKSFIKTNPLDPGSGPEMHFLVTEEDVILEFGTIRVSKDNYSKEKEVALETHILNNWDKFVENVLERAIHIVNEQTDYFTAKQRDMEKRISNLSEILDQADEPEEDGIEI